METGPRQLLRNLLCDRCSLDMLFGDRVEGAGGSRPSYSGWWQQKFLPAYSN